jgi:hypothetical protein
VIGTNSATPLFFSFRGQLMIDDNRTNAKLHVKDVVTSDEGEYKCEITFLDITKNCPVVQLVKLTTLGKFSPLQSHAHLN